ncbi:expansin C-terminal domain-related protein, partial [Clavibacter michiganensis]|uniref:expansin C-terminal domain-related protein n=1 Tax=Clavibacter michiganensis TaxID=28447 RepID=UPI00292E85A0
MRVKEGSPRWWAGLQVMNAGNRIDRVEIQAGRQWLPLTRLDHVSWETPSPIPAAPLAVRWTDQPVRSVALPGRLTAPAATTRARA